MRHWIKRLSAAGLALSLMVGQAALASEAMGHDLHAGTSPLSEGTAVTRGYFWSDTYNDLRTERYVTYTPNEFVTPSAAYGQTLLSRATLTSMARDLEAQGKRVVGGTNGDFYVLSTGQPLGLVVTDGVVRSSASYHSAVGFRSDGSAFVGTPNLLVSAVMLGERITVFGGVNKVRQIRSEEGGGLTLLTGDFGPSTENTSPGVDVFLIPQTEGVGEVLPAEENGSGQDLTLSDRVRIGGRVRCVVDYVSEAAGANPIPEGCFVLTMNSQDDEGTLNMLRSLQPGDEVEIDVTSPDPRWNEATEALGAMYRLLDNGQVGEGMSEERTARTAVGIKADGTVIFYTMDGKQPGVSVGATCAQVARRLLELGCVEAVGLDGGGSTTLGVTRPDQSAMEVVNSPSDGAQRANSTALFLTTELEPTGEAGSLALSPADALILSKAEMDFSASYVDTAWYAMSEPVEEAVYSVQGPGVVTADGHFTAEAGGSAVVTAESGDVSGQAQVTVVETPDQIAVVNEATGGVVQALSLEPGEAVSLSAAARWRGLDLISQDTCYTWECDPEVGTVTADGAFTAGDRTASGELRVIAGGTTETLPVNVAGHILKVDDMEGEESIFRSTDLVTAEMETDLAHVRTGRQSLRADYQIGETGTAVLTAGAALSGEEKYLGLWVYGDGSENSLAALFEVGGEEQAVSLCGLSFTGWKHILTPIPQGAERLKEFMFIYGGGESAAGTIWLDQVTTSNEELWDQDPPMIDLRIQGTKLTASVSDNVDRTIPVQSVKATYDGWGIEFTWDERAGKLTADLPDPGTMDHRVAVTAVDVSGNVGRACLDIAGDGVIPFLDMEDHWAMPYARYLYEQGVTTGVPSEEGVYYQPDNNITRAEFFTLTARWMGLSLDQYEDVELPFADVGAIPDWALNALKAMYAERIVLGSQEWDGLYAYPGASINRSEVMTILGRTLGKGWPEAEPEGFSDWDQTPEWARDYVKCLVGQRAVNGYEDGTLRPLAPMTRGEAAKVLDILR